MNAFKEFFRNQLGAMGVTKGDNDMEMETQNSGASGDSAKSERKEEAPKIVGKIIKVSDDGWGFIISQEIKFKRIFFHWTSLVHDTVNFTELKRGMAVEFVPVDKGDRGFHAIKVKVVDSKESTN